MSNTLPTETCEHPRRAFLVGIQHVDESLGIAVEMLDELRELAYTLGFDIVGCDIAKLRENNSAFITGSGKAKELLQQAADCNADVVVLDDFLTPAQQRNWENLSGKRAVIDRQEIILEIFAARAHTSEATLQVELAKANYSMPRLKRKWLHLSRQRGAAGGLGGRAGGEQQLELDSRVIRRRIAWLKEQLQEVRKRRDVQRTQRLNKPVPVAAIVGYTNAGKSSLLNHLTSAGILAEDKLFATLDPTVRRFPLPGGQDILLVDTVGFIRKLPHLLIEAFKSTLEETRLADFIVIVIDATSQSWGSHYEATQNVLKEIGADGKPTIVVFNKIDGLDGPDARRDLLYVAPEDSIFLSAKTGENVSELVSRLEQLASASMDVMMLRIPLDRYGELTELRKFSFINQEDYREDGVYVLARVPRHQSHRWQQYAVPFYVDASLSDESDSCQLIQEE